MRRFWWGIYEAGSIALEGACYLIIGSVAFIAVYVRLAIAWILVTTVYRQEILRQCREIKERETRQPTVKVVNKEGAQTLRASINWRQPSQLKNGEFSGARGETRFELRQYRRNSYYPNTRWFNRDGQYLGTGDLSREDLQRIAQEIEEDELFLILRANSTDSSELVRWLGARRGNYRLDADWRYRPPMPYLADKVACIVARDQIMVVFRKIPSQYGEQYRQGPLSVIYEAGVRELLLGRLTWHRKAGIWLYRLYMRWRIQRDSHLK